jgi:hypothetical protein
MHSELGTLSSGLPHSETTGSQPGCRLPCAFRRLQRPSSPLDAKTSVVRPCSITPTGRRNSHYLAALLTSLPTGFSSSRHMFGTNQLLQPSCDDWFSLTTQPFLRATYSSSYHDGLQPPRLVAICSFLLATPCKHVTLGSVLRRTGSFAWLPTFTLRYQEETCRLYPVVKDQAAFLVTDSLGCPLRFNLAEETWGRRY